MIAVIDYGMGNLRSVQKALERVGERAVVTDKPRDIKKADKLVFPGVGAFGEAMKELDKRGLTEVIKDEIYKGKIFLGLCLGLQLLFESSDEAPGVDGLAVLKGKVRRFNPKDRSLKVPHMGWNGVNKTSNGKRQAILGGIPEGAYMYFVHSYYVSPSDSSIAITKTNYGTDFVSGIRQDNIYAFQFHPEKSQAIGLKILENFAKLR